MTAKQVRALERKHLALAQVSLQILKRYPLAVRREIVAQLNQIEIIERVVA